LALDPKNSLALRTKGFLLLDERADFRGALDAYNGGFESLGSLEADFHDRARSYRHMGQYESALLDHQRAVAMAPVKGLPYASRAITWRFLGNINEAVKDLSEAMRLDRTWGLQCNLWIWEMRILRGGAGDREAAEGALAEALGPGTNPADRIYAEICSGQVTAQQALSRCKTNEQRFFTFYYLGAKALADGRRDEAKDWFGKCVSLPIHQFLEFDLARWHLEQLTQK
jgi:tetratricopeptide (TPR) repeat protein